MLSQLGLAKKCRTAYERAVELEPANIEVHQSLFGFYRAAPGIVGGGKDKALAEAAIIKKLDANRGRQAYATLYFEEKKFDLALAEFDEVLKTNPDDYNALYQIGRLAAVSRQFVDRGLAALQRCLALTPPPGQQGHAAVHWRIGNLQEKRSDPAAARAAYEASLQLDPNYAPAKDALKKLSSPAAK
jgi:tetratricopeptide (TPR) repeat protein